MPRGRRTKRAKLEPPAAEPDPVEPDNQDDDEEDEGQISDGPPLTKEQATIKDGLDRLAIVKSHYLGIRQETATRIDQIILEQDEAEQLLNELEGVRYRGGHQTSTKIFNMPYFKDKDGMTAPPNEETLRKRERGEVTQGLIREPIAWSKNQVEELERLVYGESLGSKLSELKSKREQLIAYLESMEFDEDSNAQANGDVKPSGMDLTNKELEQLTYEINEISANFQFLPLEECVEKIDWLRVAALMKSDHDYLDCQLLYCNYLHPSIKRLDFGQKECEKEREKIVELITEYGTNWELVAKKLNAGRVAWQIAQFYQMHMNTEHRKSGPLSEAERILVDGLVEQLRVGDYIPWHQIKYFVEGRGTNQLKLYWEKKTALKQGAKWTELEDKVLVAGVKLYGLRKWTKVAHYVYGRTNRQCRERYMLRVGLEDRKVGDWSKEEDRTLVKLAKELSFKWKEVEKHMPGRNVRQLTARYDALDKWHKERRKKRDQDDEDGGGDKKCVISRTRISKKSPNTKSKVESELEKELKALEKQCLKGPSSSKGVDRNVLLEKYLTDGREKLKAAFERECAKRDTNEQISTQVAIRKQKEAEIDNEIVEMFKFFNEHHKDLPKGFSRSEQDQTIVDIVTKELESLSICRERKTRTALDHVVETLIKLRVTRLPKPESSLPPILPPNRISIRAFHSLMLQRDLLAKNLVDAAPLMIVTEPTLQRLERDPSYQELLRVFMTLFFWPALFSTIGPPNYNEDAEANASKESKEKGKKKTKIELRRGRQQNAALITQIRDAQRILIDSAQSCESLRELFTRAGRARLFDPRRTKYYREHYEPKKRNTDFAI